MIKTCIRENIIERRYFTFYRSLIPTLQIVYDSITQCLRMQSTQTLGKTRSERPSYFLTFGGYHVQPSKSVVVSLSMQVKDDLK